MLLRDPKLRDKAYERFPILAQRRKQVAGLLSGGEQQMLSLAPALADPPKVLIADEPTLGLAPLAAETVMQAILELRDAGTAVLLVEEHAQNALKVADTLVVHGARNDRVGRSTRRRPTWSCSRAPTSAARATERRSTSMTVTASAPRFADAHVIPAPWSRRCASTARCSSIEMIDGETVAAINREVDDAVAAAEPGAKTVNAAIQAFFGPHTKHVSSLAAVSPTFANEVMTHPTYLAACDAILLPQCSRYRLNLGHLIVRGPGAEAQIPHRDEDVWPHFPRPARRHPDRVDPRPRRLPGRERRDARRARKPPVGARPPTRARRDRRRGGPRRRRRHLPRVHHPFRGHELHRRRVAARGARQLHARLAAHRGEQRARRSAEDRAATSVRRHRRSSGTRSTTRSPTAAATSGWCACATRWSCSQTGELD